MLGRGESVTAKQRQILILNQVPLQNIVQITASYSHTCALTTEGGVKCWGANRSGQLGDGTQTDRVTPVAVAGLSNGATAVVAGEGHSCALMNNGGVKCWGDNSYGELGDGTEEPYRITPVDVVGLSIGATALATRGDHTCALMSNGGVKCWGYNDNGQLGDGTYINRTTPVDVVDLNSNIVAIFAGYDRTCGITVNGAVVCWRGTPTAVAGLSSGIATMSINYGHTCVVTTGGGAKCWGANRYGQLGDGTTNSSSTLVDVVGLTSGVTSIAMGETYTCALLNNSSVKCWGENHNGKLGNGTTGLGSFTPVDVEGLSSDAIGLAGGQSHTCVLKSSGRVFCWGSNSSGQLGDGTTGAARAAPIDVVGINSGATGLALGRYHSCAVVNGVAKCWGENRDGQLGDGSLGSATTPAYVAGLNTDVINLAADGQHTCALTSDGGIKCWGYNGNGQLGDGTTTMSTTPIDVVGLSSGVIGIGAGLHKTCAVITGGATKCWGTVFYTPQDVIDLSSGVIAVVAGLQHQCVLTSVGGVKCWGQSTFGVLGSDTQNDTATPVDVPGMTSNVIALTAGDYHNCAVLSTGTVKCWGANESGQLGDGTFDQHGMPMAVVSLDEAVVGIAAGRRHTCALTNSGGVKCWGDIASGSTGNVIFELRSTPVDVANLNEGVAMIAAGGQHSCAVTNSGSVKCWGRNSSGQLGDGNAFRTIPVEVVEIADNPSEPTPTAITTLTPTPTMTPTNTPTPTATAVPTTTLVSSENGGILTVDVGVDVTIIFPKGAVSEPVQVSIQKLGEPPALNGFQLLGDVFAINAYNGQGNSVTQFNDNFQIIISYADSDLNSVREDELRLYFWQEDLGWVIVDNVTVDVLNNTVTALLNHLTTFAVLDRVDDSIYLPLIQQ